MGIFRVDSCTQSPEGSSWSFLSSNHRNQIPELPSRAASRRSLPPNGALALYQLRMRTWQRPRAIQVWDATCPRGWKILWFSFYTCLSFPVLFLLGPGSHLSTQAMGDELRLLVALGAESHRWLWPKPGRFSTSGHYYK